MCGLFNGCLDLGRKDDVVGVHVELAGSCDGVGGIVRIEDRCDQGCVDAGNLALEEVVAVACKPGGHLDDEVFGDIAAVKAFDFGEGGGSHVVGVASKGVQCVADCTGAG